jgi:uroporphyrinogen decarboxylase
MNDHQPSSRAASCRPCAIPLARRQRGSRERLLKVLAHQEPDRVPLDLGSTQVTGIHVVAYHRLRKVLGLPPVEAQICDYIQGLALPDPDVIEHLGVDVRGLFPLNSHNWQIVEREDGEYWSYHDEWGITHRKPRVDGLYYSLWKAPLDGPELTAQDIASHPWPRLDDPRRIAGLRQLAEAYRAEGYAVVLKDPFAGLFEMAQRIVGMENLLVMMAADKTLAIALFDKLAELKLAFWEMALPQLADVVDVISQADDYGTQVSQIISPRMFREQLKPRWKIIFDRLQVLAPNARRFFHSCGNVRPLIPDYIELGVEILNPVHVRATGMEPVALKRDFGDALVFWGGGVDTQGALPNGTPQEVKDDVRRNVEALAPGGGFVFNTVHNIQADVPAENLAAMYEALSEYGNY